MTGAEVHGVLQAAGVTHLHHANTVTTSCTFLQKRGLLSRGWIEYYKLPQIRQSSDDIDKKYSIWNDVFMDGVDIHDRASCRISTAMARDSRTAQVVHEVWSQHIRQEHHSG